MKNYFLNHKITIFLSGIGLIVFIIIIIILNIFLAKPAQDQPKLEPSIPPEINHVFQTQVNRTTEDQVKSMTGLKDVRQITQGTEYSFPSINTSADNTIITNDNIVIFEKKFTADTSFVHPELSSYLSLLGEPESILPGSKTYGRNVNFYIFASKGITIIGRPFSDEVEEVQQYTPMTVDEYIKIWGSDIQENIEERPEHP